MEEMMTTTTAFIRGEAAAASKKKGQPMEGQGSSRFTPLTRTPKEILAAEVGKFKPPPPTVTPVEKRSSNKFCDFHNDKGHNTDECRDQLKVGKKEVPAKDKSMEIYMVQPWHRMTRKKVTQSFSRVSEITFPPQLINKYGTEGDFYRGLFCSGVVFYRIRNWRAHNPPHVCRRWFLNESTLRALLQPTLAKNQEPNGPGNDIVNRSLSPYNSIIGRPGIKEIQVVPSTGHGMLKFPVDRGIVTICSTILIPAECATVTTSSKEILKEAEVHHENFKVVLHSNFPDQEVAIGGTLSAKGRTELCSLLKDNFDIFAWQPSDITGVPRSVAEHRLNIWEGYSPVQQKKRGQAPEHAKAIQAE
ncbi:hypothetical protein Tco_0985351, partial [Tanacetum coccineum]